MDNQPKPQSFNERLRAARKAAGFTLDSVSASLSELGVKRSKQAVGHWETGHAAPDAETLVHLCKMFSVSADYLLFGSGEIDIGGLHLDERTYNTVATFDASQIERLKTTIVNRVQEIAGDKAASSKGAQALLGNGRGAR